MSRKWGLSCRKWFDSLARLARAIAVGFCGDALILCLPVQVAYLLERAQPICYRSEVCCVFGELVD